MIDIINSSQFEISEIIKKTVLNFMNQLLLEIPNKIYKITRGDVEYLVMMEQDLAFYYETEVSKINQARSRNKNRFENRHFKLTQEEYDKIVKENPSALNKKVGYIPTVYTEEGALALSSVLTSKRAEEMFSILLKSFYAFKQIIQSHPELMIQKEVFELRQAMIDPSKKIIVIQNFHNHGFVQMGEQNSMAVQVNSLNDVMKALIELSEQEEIKNNKDYKKIVQEAILEAAKGDKRATLEKTKVVLEVVNNMADLATKAAPVLMPIITWLMKQVS